MTPKSRGQGGKWTPQDALSGFTPVPMRPTRENREGLYLGLGRLREVAHTGGAVTLHRPL